jgi:3-hydroxyisobutyrate dehydrogenase-like beta-hydroxyacid dehydrogenase
MDGPMDGPMGGETRLPDACELVACNADAVRMADVVIAVTTGADSLTACEQSRPHLAPGTLYADLSTGAPGDKRRLAELLEPAGAAVVDGAIMAPIPLRGLATPILASGPEAGRFAAVAGGLGMSVTPIGGSPGDAAARKLLRSVLVKGLSALVIESQRAAEEAGLGEWFWGHLLETVTAVDEEFVVRLLKGAGQHGVRRVHEMEAAARMLESLGVPDTMTRATAATLDEVTRTGVPPVPGPS